MQEVGTSYDPGSRKVSQTIIISFVIFCPIFNLFSKPALGIKAPEVAKPDVASVDMSVEIEAEKQRLKEVIV